MKDRDKAIDFLRGFSILMIILIHVLAKYVSYHYPLIIWNYLHFVEALIVFCSGASLAYSHASFKGMKDVFSFIKKRLERFYVPWWAFLIVFLSANFIFDFLAHVPFRFSLIYLIKTVFAFGIAGGLGYGWILLLLLVFSLFYPLLIKAAEKIGYERMFFLIVILSFGLHYLYSLNLVKDPLSAISYLQYLLPFFLGICYVKRKRMNLPVIGVFYFLIYISLFFSSSSSGGNSMFTAYSYPPNLFFMSYGVFMSIFLLYLLKIPGLKHIQSNTIADFYSRNSLWIYMWHILILGIVYQLFLPFEFINNEPWWILKYIVVVILSSILVISQNFAMPIVKNMIKGIKK